MYFISLGKLHREPATRNIVMSFTPSIISFKRFAHQYYIRPLPKFLLLSSYTIEDQLLSGLNLIISLIRVSRRVASMQIK